MSGPHSVLLVFDTEAGAKLLTWRRAGEPMWVVASPANAPVLARIWAGAEPGAWDPRTGVSSFPLGRYGSLDEAFAAILDLIEEHHLPPDVEPYPELRVIGLQLGPSIESALREAGFESFETHPSGFVARCA